MTLLFLAMHVPQTIRLCIIPSPLLSKKIVNSRMTFIYNHYAYILVYLVLHFMREN